MRMENIGYDCQLLKSHWVTDTVECLDIYMFLVTVHIVCGLSSFCVTVCMILYLRVDCFNGDEVVKTLTLQSSHGLILVCYTKGVKSGA